MYKISDYITRGCKFINNELFPTNKKLSTLMLYTTDCCNSHCKHCYIWDKKNKKTLPLEKIKEVIESPVVDNNTTVSLEGGEFLLHPEAEAILSYIVNTHPKFDLLSNGILTEKLINLIKKYQPQRLYLSLDGTPETYKRMRGVDAYSKVVETIQNLNNIVPISVMFTLSPFNTFDDLRHVIKICHTYNIDLRIGIYNQMEYFDTKVPLNTNISANWEINDIPKEVCDFPENYDFLALYTLYRQGKLKLSCNSLRDSIVIYPNGDVPICQNKEIIIGNIFDNSLSEIINGEKARKLQKEKKNCNECWINFHRKYDIVLFRTLEKFLPRFVIKQMLGNYYWEKDSKKKYRDIIY